MVQAASQEILLEAFLKLPETKPASEFIDGQIIQKPMPKGEHSAIQGELTTAINSVTRSRKIARAFSELCCTFGGRSIVPDVSILVGDCIPRQKNGGAANVFSIAPNWLIQILSPDQSQTKLTAKILHCLKHETQMAWLIDPSEQAVTVYQPQQLAELFDQTDQQTSAPKFAEQLRLTAGELFGWPFE